MNNGPRSNWNFRFDGGQLSSDGSVLLLREIENGLGLADLLSSRMKDERDPASTTYSLADMIRVNTFQPPNSYCKAAVDKSAVEKIALPLVVEYWVRLALNLRSS